MTNFVIYKSHDEVLITTKKSEQTALAEYFDAEYRYVDEFTRTEVDDSIVIVSVSTELSAN
jgi:hypothetical protein